jgi:CheY-like chemotaxis protein
MRKNLLEVVLVEDDEVEIEAVTRALRNLHIAHDLAVYRTGAHALASLHQERRHLQRSYPFFMLLDLTLPDMPGLQVLQALRQDPLLRAAIVFVLTISDNEEDKLGAYDYHVAGYLIKSNLGKNYERLTELIGAYYEVVEFPNR